MNSEERGEGERRYIIPIHHFGGRGEVGGASEGNMDFDAMFLSVVKYAMRGRVKVSKQY